MISPYSFTDYKEYIHAQIQAHSAERGYRSRLAEAAGCQMSYLSQLLHGTVQLTPDHALGLCSFWGLGENERDYFLELVHLARAGTRALKGLIAQRLEQMKKRAENLADRFNQPRVAEGVREVQYYSNWCYSAIHILTTIPAFQTVRAMAQRLFLPESFVEESLIRLEAMGLVRFHSGRWLATQAQIHLPKESLLNVMNHSNWRQRAALSAQLHQPGSLHYTAVHSMSREDYERIKDDLLRLIDQSRKVVTDSKEEELVNFNCDWFVV
ncbi:TIGR02147 family protein [Bdellovibrionota bacterium FG-1]